MELQSLYRHLALGIHLNVDVRHTCRRAAWETGERWQCHGSGVHDAVVYTMYWCMSSTARLAGIENRPVRRHCAGICRGIYCTGRRMPGRGFRRAPQLRLVPFARKLVWSAREFERGGNSLVPASNCHVRDSVWFRNYAFSVDAFLRRRRNRNASDHTDHILLGGPLSVAGSGVSTTP